MAQTRSEPALPVPKGFRIARELSVGRHPLLAMFPGADKLPVARRLVPDAPARPSLFSETEVELVDQDLWMYVAPHEKPKIARSRGWKPVVSKDKDCIVVGASHLAESPALVLFMDIFHELRHVLQRHAGANLWEPGVSYVERWTEVEAYRFVITEARDLGASEEFLREYLKVEWISEAEHRKLLVAVGVPPE